MSFSVDTIDISNNSPALQSGWVGSWSYVQESRYNVSLFNRRPVSALGPSHSTSLTTNRYRYRYLWPPEADDTPLHKSDTLLSTRRDRKSGSQKPGWRRSSFRLRIRDKFESGNHACGQRRCPSKIEERHGIHQRPCPGRQTPMGGTHTGSESSRTWSFYLGCRGQGYNTRQRSKLQQISTIGLSMLLNVLTAGEDARPQVTACGELSACQH